MFKIPRRRNKIERSFIFKVIKFIVMVLIICLFVGVIACTIIYDKIKDDLSASIQKGYDIVSTISDDDFNTKYATVLYDKDGNVLKEFQTNDYIYCKYEDTNINVFNALIAIEDKRYYQHKGFDLKGFARGIYTTVLLGNSQGGSTITQQLVKNIYLTSEATVWRKVSEAVISQELEKIYTKEQILEFYTNNVNYANGCYSFESASEYYFQKNNNDLTVAEIAFITAIPNNPSKYNPLTNYDNTIERKNIILKEMYDLGMLTKEEYETEKDREIVLNKKTVHLNNDVSDYAQSYAVHKAVEEIMKINGFQFVYNFSSDDERSAYWDLYSEEYGNARSELISGGYEIYTCIDPELQDKLQSIVDAQMSSYTATNESTGLYKKQASATVIDNSTGMVAAIVGGRSQSDVVNSYNRAYLSARQPGSSIKPLIVYTPAFELGYTPSDKMNDEYIKDGPKNAGGGYSGIVSLRYAVEKSINTIAYKMCEIVTPTVGINKLATMHFRYLDSSDKDSPIIAVGGFKYGTNTLEMSSAYSALARNGAYIEPTNIYKIVKVSDGSIVYENQQTTVQVYDEGAAYLMVDCMKGVLISGTGKSYRPTYKYMAAKTGTTNDSKDVWICGCSPYYSMSVWVGDDTPSAQSHMTAQGKIFQTMMNYLHEGLEEIDFTIPDSVEISESGNLSYVIEAKENLRKERVDEELDRKGNEILKIQDRLNGISYIIEDGLSEDEELAREELAASYIEKLKNFNLQKSSQFEDLNNMLDDTLNAIEKIKNTTVYDDYLGQYKSLKRSFENQMSLITYNEENSDNDIWQSIFNPQVDVDDGYEDYDEIDDYYDYYE